MRACGTITAWDAALDADEDESYDDHVHIIFLGVDDPMHLSSSECWCEPELIEYNKDTGVKIFSHRQMH